MTNLPATPVRVRASVAREVTLLSNRYGISTEELTRSCLAFINLVVSPRPPAVGKPNATPQAHAGAEIPPPAQASARANAADEDDAPDEPDVSTNKLDDDLGGLLFPQFELRTEINRVASLLEDNVLFIRQTQLSVEAFCPPVDFGRPKPNAAAKLPQSMQIVRVSEPVSVADLKSLAFTFPLGNTKPESALLPQRYDGWCISETLNFGSDEAPLDFACDVSAVVTWLPWMHQYRLLPLSVGLPKENSRMSASDAQALVEAYGLLVGHIVDACAFLLRVNSGLPEQDFRQDLMLACERSRRIHDGIQKRLLEIEVIIHSLRTFAESMAESLLILGSKAPAGCSIYEKLKGAVPGTEGNRRPKGGPNIATLDPEALRRLSESM